MARFNCLATFLAGKKKRSKDSPKSVDITKTEDHTKPFVEDAKKENHFNASIMLGTKQNSFTFSVKMVGNDDLVRAEVAPEASYEAGDEHEEVLSMKRDFSDLDLQALAADNMLIAHELVVSNQEVNPETDNQPERDEQVTREADIQNIHLSDPEMGRATAFWGSPVLKRSCSNIETKRAGRGFMSRMKSHSYNDLQNLSRKAEEGPLSGLHGSPRSVMTNCSADRVMLKKRSSSQVLPSRSRKLWWKLFLWSHRNLHKPRSMKPQNRVSVLSAMNQKGGYSSDTLEPSSSNYKKNKKAMEDQESGSRTDLWPQSQWVAFSAESESSPLDRVNAWVNSLDVHNDGNDDGEEREAIVFPSSPEIGESSGKNHSASLRVEEAIQANNLIQSLNSFSSVAHIFGMGLKVIPAISAFSSLRAVNLSNNFITHITPGSLPKSLHTLDLSRNKIGAIEGLRELTRLRVLNLSYNRISSIGHGLSNCTIIKELYLAGNKISDVEGLHRLLKLAVLDLSFNKITTAKSLGQLVANYNSLLALNLLGNPIQSNIGDDQLRKAVTGLLPQLTYLNKQSIRPQRAREVATDSVAKAALGNGGWSSRRRPTRRESPGSSGKGRDGSVHRGLGSGSGSGHKSNRHRTKSSK